MQINIYGKEGEEKGFSFRSLIDRNELQRIQDEFCAVTGLYAYCVDAGGEQQTQVSGDAGEWQRLKDYVTEPLISHALIRVAEGSLEDFAVENVIVPNIKVVAISIRIEGKNIFTWIAAGVLTDAETAGYQEKAVTDFRRMITENAFYKALDFLRNISITLFRNKLSCVSAEAESMRSRYSEQEMKDSLSRLAAMTEVVQMIDSDDTIEAVMNKVLEIVGQYLNTSSAQLYSVRQDKGCMDVICEWCNEGVVSLFDRTKNLELFEFLNTDKPLVIGSDIMPAYACSKELADLGITATIIFPLKKKQEIGMYVCFCQRERNRVWKIEEVKFVSDSVKILQSIVIKRIQKNSLASSYVSLEAVLDNVGCCIYVKDAVSGKPLFANRLLKKTFAEELKEESFQPLLDIAIPLGKSTGSYELNHSERERWYDLLYTEISWVDGRKASLYSLYDITDKKVYQKKIEQQAYTDFLTGLFNRMCCERDLAWHIDDTKRRSMRGGILYLDLDDFKHINDGLGHQYGDVLLKSISDSLQNIKGIKSTCYRMGGDEFVIVVPSESYREIDRIIGDIHKIFTRPWNLRDADYYCTMSMGIVTFPDDGDSVQDLIKKADIAMYEAKKRGKNRTARYSESLGSLSGRRLDMEKNMRDATAEGYREFEVYFQPIIDISGDKPECTGAEALIRWNSAELGFIPPSDFIPLAEYLGLINPIGNHVLKEACICCKYWNDNGYPNYKVNVNLSVIQLLQSDIIQIVEDTLKETGVKSHNLTLEVTESLAINDMNRMKEILSSIKQLGVRIALDDFGTGYSSLNHIREIPFDVIKVEQSFVKDLAEDAYSQSFIKMVAELAATLGASICVEGIETAAQYEVLEDMKVLMVQGYYFDKAMPRQEFEDKYVVK